MELERADLGRHPAEAPDAVLEGNLLLGEDAKFSRTNARSASGVPALERGEQGRDALALRGVGRPGRRPATAAAPRRREPEATGAQT